MRDEPHRFRVAPLTVLVDPAQDSGSPRTPDADLSYLFDHQLAEADLVCLTKADAGGTRRPRSRGWWGAGSAQEPARAWTSGCDFVLGEHGKYSGRQLSVDYTRYAAAEAALAWLNWRVGAGAADAGVSGARGRAADGTARCRAD